MQKQEKQNHTSQKGITLIALIITIIIMLILVIVTITISDTGGLFNYAGNAVRETQNAINAEQSLVVSIEDYIAGESTDQKYFKYTLDETTKTATITGIKNEYCQVYENSNCMSGPVRIIL